MFGRSLSVASILFFFLVNVSRFPSLVVAETRATPRRTLVFLLFLGCLVRIDSLGTRGRRVRLLFPTLFSAPAPLGGTARTGRFARSWLPLVVVAVLFLFFPFFSRDFCVFLNFRFG